MRTPDSSDDDLPLNPLLARLDDGTGGADERAPTDARRLADQLFVDALLERVHQGAPAALDDQIRSAMARIGTSQTELIPAAGVTRRRWITSSLQAAAGIGAVGVGWLAVSTLTTPTAEAAVARAIEDARLERDRHYAISTEISRPGEGKTLRGDLYVRGAERFAVRHESPLGGVVWVGGDQKTVWIIPAAGPAFVAADPRRMDQWIEERELPLPVLQVTAVLTHLQGHYDLELLAPERLEESAERMQHVRGRRRAAVGLLPTTIDVWIHPRSGNVQRLSLDWERRLDPLPGPRRIQFDLVDQVALAGDWYTAEAHLDRNRPVIRF